MRTCLLHIVLAVLMWPLLSPVSVAAAAAPAPAAAADDNAALRYWRAISVLPQLDEKQSQALSQWATIAADDPQVGNLLENARTALTVMRRGSTLPRCAWGTDLESEGFETLLPHLARMRELGRYGVLQSRVWSAKGLHKEAVDEAIVVLRVARHTGSDPLLISVLVEYAMESMVVDRLAASLPTLPKDQQRRLADELAKAPPRHTIRDGIAGERLGVKWMRRIIKDHPEKVAQLTNDLQGAIEIRTRPIEPMLIDLEKQYDEIERIVSLDMKEFDEAAEKFEKSIAAAKNPLVRVLVPAVARSRTAEFIADIRMKLLRAAIAHEIGGDEAEKTVAGIMGGLTLERKKTDSGCDYTCPQRNDRDGKPVTLRVGTPAAR